MNMAVQENFFDLEDSFGEKDGFRVAAAITSYDSSPDVVEDPDYGTLKFMMKSFGYDRPGVNFDDLASELCGPETFTEETIS